MNSLEFSKSSYSSVEGKLVSLLGNLLKKSEGIIVAPRKFVLSLSISKLN